MPAGVRCPSYTTDDQRCPFWASVYDAVYVPVTPLYYVFQPVSLSSSSLVCCFPEPWTELTLSVNHHAFNTRDPSLLPGYETCHLLSQASTLYTLYTDSYNTGLLQVNEIIIPNAAPRAEQERSLSEPRHCDLLNTWPWSLEGFSKDYVHSFCSFPIVAQLSHIIAIR